MKAEISAPLEGALAQANSRPPSPEDLFDELIRSLAIKPGTHIEGDGCVRITVPAEILKFSMQL